jgi:hypothetical protein
LFRSKLSDWDHSWKDQGARSGGPMWVKVGDILCLGYISDVAREFFMHTSSVEPLWRTVFRFNCLVFILR